MPRKLVSDPLVKKPNAALLERLAKTRLQPSLVVRCTCVGGTFANIEVAWTTLLVDGTLRIVCDGNRDITSLLAIDEVALKASGTVDLQGVGLHVLDAAGQFLARLVPLGTIALEASGSVYMPY